MSDYRRRSFLQWSLPILVVVGGGLCFATAGVAQTKTEEAPAHETVTNSIGMKLVLIPVGEFLMGTPESNTGFTPGDETPQHRVRITKSFYLGACEVTQPEWQTVMGYNPSAFASTGQRSLPVEGLDTSRFPVERVSWYDAVQYCNKLSERESLTAYYRITEIERTDGSISRATVSILGGDGYRLPTEAEWEYACRAGTTTPFHFGSTSNGRESNVKGDSPYGTATEGPSLGHPTTVGSYAPNAFGLYDMHGNVAEWCADLFDVSAYENRGDVTNDPFVGFGDVTDRVLRGGAWDYQGKQTYSAIRLWSPPDARHADNGFRLARTAPQPSVEPRASH